MGGGGKRAGTGFFKAMLYFKKRGAFNLTRGSSVRKTFKKTGLGFQSALAEKMSKNLLRV